MWDRTQKITWFHILLARNNLSFFAVTRSPAHLANRQWSCLAVQALASNLPQAIFKTAITDTISSSSFVVDVDGCCVTITYFPDHVVLNPRTRAREPDCHPDTRIDTCKLGCLLPRKQSSKLCSKLHCIYLELSFHYTIHYLVHCHLHF